MKNKSAFANLLAAVEKAKNGTPAQKSDIEFWRCEQDKAGNAYAQIRFLPGKTDDDVPFVKVYSHGFQGNTGKWFIEDCPTTVGEQCPVCSSNAPLWNSGLESDKEIVRKRKRKTAYVSNILVVSDPKNPDNDGKVFLFKYGQKIFDKIKDKISPPCDERGNPIDPDDQPMNPFDNEDGCNFKLKIRKVEGYANYDKSEFEGPSAIKDWDAVRDQMLDLEQFVDPKKMKSYVDLEKKMNYVLGNTPEVAPIRGNDADDDQQFVKSVVTSKKPVPKVDDDDDDDMARFMSMAEAD